MYPWNGDAKDVSNQNLVALFKDAFHFAMVTIYAQGMAQLTIASKEFNYGLNLD